MCLVPVVVSIRGGRGGHLATIPRDAGEPSSLRGLMDKGRGHLVRCYDRMPVTRGHPVGESLLGKGTIPLEYRSIDCGRPDSL